MRAAQFLSLNDDMSGGAVMSQSLEVVLYVGFGEIHVLLVESIMAVHVASMRKRRGARNNAE